MAANNDAEFQEVREWESLFHDLIEEAMAGEGDGGTWCLRCIHTAWRMQMARPPGS